MFFFLMLLFESYHFLFLHQTHTEKSPCHAAEMMLNMNTAVITIVTSLLWIKGTSNNTVLRQRCEFDCLILIKLTPLTLFCRNIAK